MRRPKWIFRSRDVGYGVQSLTLGDFTNDGRLDVVVVDTKYPETTSVLLLAGGSNGLLDDPVSIYGSIEPLLDVSSGDLNEDGRLDLVVISPSEVRVLYQTDTGSFSPPVKFSVETGTTSVAVGDVDGDLRQDIIFYGTILLNKPAGFEASPSRVGNTFGLGDVTGDSVVDIVSPTSAGVAVTSYAPPDGFLRPIFYASGLGFSPFLGEVGIGDITGDGRQDVLVTFSSSDPLNHGSLATYRQTPSGDLRPDRAHTLRFAAESVGVIDRENGRADVLIGHGEGELGGLKGGEAGRLGPECFFNHLREYTFSSTDLEIGDLNNDSIPDAVFGFLGGLSVTLGRG